MDADATQPTGGVEQPKAEEKKPKTAGQLAYEAYAGHFRDDVKEDEWWGQSSQSRNAWEAAAGAAIQLAATKA
jgi:hypothetical protein